ncbi:MAG: hypothetical protein CSA62_04515 [Planctomycetota bacterium]|nr:MAG: hypothetical protein CSA62_04515 [Planctomycetota bacterium]
MSRRYLLIRLTALGDIIFALEAFAALRAADPEAEIDWVVEDRWQTILGARPDLGRAIIYPRRLLQRALLRPWLWPKAVLALWAHCRELRRTRYDALLELQGNLKGGLHALLAKATRKIGFAGPRARELSWLFVQERVAVGRPRPHRVREGLQLVEQLLGKQGLQPSQQPLLPRSEASAAYLAEWLQQQFGTTPSQLVVLAPGTSVFAAFKRWPAARFAELAKALLAEGRQVVISAGPGEEALAEACGALRGPAPGRPILFAGGEHGLPVFLELLRRARIVVAADSAPLHLAQATGTAVVGLFGPKDPSVYGPWRQPAILRRYPAACAPCGRRDCALPICVQGIPSEAVLESLRQLAPMEGSEE